MSAHPELLAQDAQFPKHVVELAPNVHGAVGFAASNVYMLIGDDGLVIIDTTETTKAAENILAEFRKITDKPIKTIIFTHSHRDHISGATVFADGGSPEIIAHDEFATDMVGVDQSRPTPIKAMMARTKRQFGFGLSYPEERVSLGVGPGKRPLEGMGAGFIPPTVFMSEERTKIKRYGLELELVKAPGETPDHIVVWFADHKILFCGDNFYSSFPNLYALRGTPYREYDAWADTMDLLLSFNAAILAPGHTLPITNATKIQEVLTDYREAIRYLVSQTAAGMNKQLNPDELAHSVRLPDELAGKPHLKEFYGKVSWSVRSYFAGTLGWFDGNPTNLARMTPAQSAQRMMALVGGADKLLEAAQNAQTSGDHQWALELVDHLIAAEEHAKTAISMKARSLRAMADLEINAAGRNYYLVSAQELEETL